MLEDMLKSGQIWGADQHKHAATIGMATGFSELDAALPGGGWPQDGITEILCAEPGMGEFSLLLPALAQVTQQSYAMLVCCPFQLHLPGIEYDLRQENLLLIQPQAKDMLWTLEQSLSSGCCGAMVFWAQTAPDFKAYRRLQILSLQHQVSTFFILREQKANSPCRLRLAIHARQQQDLNIRLLKGNGIWGTRDLTVSLPQREYLRYPMIDSGSVR